MDPLVMRPRVLIVGGGPAGLTAAAMLAPQLGEGEVLLVERERDAGGIPRHSDHPGYGIRDLHRFMNGPAYARRLLRRARRSGARILTETTVTEWAGPRAVLATGPEGRIRIVADAVVLATGARERPRSARLIPGDRGAGIYTTGMLQNLVHLKAGRPGARAVIVGAELVSWSAALTLQRAGCRTVLITSEHPRAEAYPLFSWPGRLFFRTRVATGMRVVRVFGAPRVEGVEIERIATGERRTIRCDTVVFTGDWIADNELARAAGIELAPVSRAPIADEALRSGIPGVFLAGNVLHPVDTADVAALDGRAVARHVLGHLAGPGGEPDANADAGVRLSAEAPLRWVSPGRVRLDGTVPPRNRLLLWTDEYRAFARVQLRQGGRVVAQRRLLWPAAPGRVFRVPASILRGLSVDDGDITVGLG